MDLQTLIMCRKYTDETVIGLGGLKGANCTIYNIEKKDGQNIVTFEWTATDGSKRYNQLVIDDGTPIIPWVSGNLYHFGDIVIYQGDLYRCTKENRDRIFDATKWEELNSADGNYDIVINKEDLPARFTPADKKMYYVIQDGCFYLWDGFLWIPQFETENIDFSTFLV